MPTFRVNVKTSQKGQIFKASVTHAAGTRMVTQINEALAQEGVNRALAILGNVLKNPTGYYESRVGIKTGQAYRGVWDNNVVYGGWLEGVSSRNATTRFKGYHTFRQVKQSLNRDKEQLAQRFVDQYIREMNG